MADRAMGFVIFCAPTLPHNPEDFIQALTTRPTPCLDGVPVSEHNMTRWVERRSATLQCRNALHVDLCFNFEGS